MRATASIPNNDLPPRGKKHFDDSRGWRRLLLKLFPYHFLLQLKFEMSMIAARWKYRFLGPRISGHDLMVNIGCGSAGQLGWLNIDGFPAKNVDLVYDIRKSLPLPDGCARGIFCEHLLEHLEYSEEVPYFLTECLRVLRPGGLVRFVVPDAEMYLMAYAQGGWETLTKTRPLGDKHRDHWFGSEFQTRMELINLVFRQGVEHKFAYDWETLDIVLRKFGFESVTRRKFGEGALPALCLDKPERASESLYVEAVKAQAHG